MRQKLTKGAVTLFKASLGTLALALAFLAVGVTEVRAESIFYDSSTLNFDTNRAISSGVDGADRAFILSTTTPFYFSAFETPLFNRDGNPTGTYYGFIENSSGTILATSTNSFVGNTLCSATDAINSANYGTCKRKFSFALYEFAASTNYYIAIGLTGHEYDSVNNIGEVNSTTGSPFSAGYSWDANSFFLG